MIHFADVRGHGRAIETLQTALTRDLVHHAYLFSGPDGIGRRTLTEAFTAALVCTTGGGDACGACKSCHQLESGTHPNVKVLAGEKPPTVDDVRELLRWVSLRTVGGGRRVVRIPDLERLNLNAINALLKTLEEPPPGTTFLMTTTGLQQILPTVRSRCQKISLSPLPRVDVEALLVARGGLSPERAARLAPLAEGCPGRALLLGEEALELRDQLITSYLAAPTASLADCLKWSDGFGGDKDTGRTHRSLDLLESLIRDALVVQLAPGRPLVNDDHAEGIRRWATQRTPRAFESYLGMIEEGREALRLNVRGPVVLERLYLGLRG